MNECGSEKTATSPISTSQQCNSVNNASTVTAQEDKTTLTEAIWDFSLAFISPQPISSTSSYISQNTVKKVKKNKKQKNPDEWVRILLLKGQLQKDIVIIVCIRMIISDQKTEQTRVRSKLPG